MAYRIFMCVLTCVVLVCANAQPKEKRWSYLLEKSSKNSRERSLKPFFLLEVNELSEHIFTDYGVLPARRLEDSLWVVSVPDSLIPKLGDGGLPEVNNLWKLSDNIFDLKSGKKYWFLVQTISNDIAHLSSWYDSSSVIEVADLIYLMELTPEEAREMVDAPAVSFISYEGISPSTESRVIDLNLNPNRISKLHKVFPQYQGQGVTISIQERSYDTDDLDLLGRHVDSGLASGEITNHATEMATTIAGAGNSFITGKGVASAARITSSNFEMPLPDDQSLYSMYDVSVQNHSYGTIVENFYGIEAQAFDKIGYEKQDLLHVFSSGNAGQEASSEGNYEGISGFANLTGNFKTAKNILLVGSVDTLGRSVGFVSRGPAYDGRVKPDISAYSMVGSSNSAAMVSGTAALLQQAYRATNGGYPGSDLIKCLLITGSDELDEPGPDHTRGFGNLNACKSMQLLENRQYFTGSVQLNDTKAYEINLTEHASLLKVGLTWVDPPANPGDALALINNLDLTIESPEGTVYHPWILKTTPDASDLGTSAIRGVDHLNNVELVSIIGPSAGAYKIYVSGSSMLSDRQSFGIVYSVDTVGKFEWDYPNSMDNFPYNGETGTYFRWSSTLEPVSGRIQYKFSEEPTWSDIGTADLRNGHYRWNNPPLTSSGLAQARMLVGNDTFYTESFTISEQLQSSVGFNCGDSIELTWAKVDDAAFYNIYQPGDKYLELTRSLTANSLVLSTDEISSNYFSVEPVRADGVAYLPSYTFDYTRQGAGCFLSSFYQEVVVEEGIYLNLVLGSKSGISHIDFEARRNGIYELVQSVSDIERNLRVLDPYPNQGHNVHRVTVYFRNGQRIQQTADGTYYLTDKASLVFPNPVFSSRSVRVYTREFDSQKVLFTLYDRAGGKVLDYHMRSTQEAIPLYDLRSGVYFYILTAGEERYRGKLIVK